MALAVAAYGLSCGVLAVSVGLSPVLATLSSALVLAGGSQFAFVGVLTAGGNPLMGAVGGLLLNLRYLAFGMAIAPYLPPGRRRRRLLDAYLVVDESVALGLVSTDERVVHRFRLVGVAVVRAWIGATALGAYGGQLLGDLERFGLDAGGVACAVRGRGAGRCGGHRRPTNAGLELTVSPTGACAFSSG